MESINNNQINDLDIDNQDYAEEEHNDLEQLEQMRRQQFSKKIAFNFLFEFKKKIPKQKRKQILK
jgi:hypothetical protein